MGWPGDQSGDRGAWSANPTLFPEEALLADGYKNVPELRHWMLLPLCLQDTEGRGGVGVGVGVYHTFQKRKPSLSGKAKPPDAHRDRRDNTGTVGPMKHPHLEANISIWGEDTTPGGGV